MVWHWIEETTSIPTMRPKIRVFNLTYFENLKLFLKKKSNIDIITWRHRQSIDYESWRCSCRYVAAPHNCIEYTFIYNQQWWGSGLWNTIETATCQLPSFVSITVTLIPKANFLDLHGIGRVTWNWILLWSLLNYSYNVNRFVF